MYFYGQHLISNDVLWSRLTSLCRECWGIRDLRITIGNRTDRDIRLSPEKGHPTLNQQCFEYMNQVESSCKLGCDWSNTSHCGYPILTINSFKSMFIINNGIYV